jgi:hypothetical protein
MSNTRYYNDPPRAWQPEDLRGFVKELQQFLRDKEDKIQQLEGDNHTLAKQLERSQESVIRYKSALEGLGSRSSSGSSRIPDPEFQKLTQLDIRNNSHSNGVLTDLVIVFDPLDKSTRKLNSAYLPSKSGLLQSLRTDTDTLSLGKNYVKIDLPSFHWWSDEISIYQDLDVIDTNTGNPKIIVRKRQKCLRGESRVATIPLGQLGWDIRLQRIFGKIKVMYVLSMDPPSPMEMGPPSRAQ